MFESDESVMKTRGQGHSYPNVVKDFEGKNNLKKEKRKVRRLGHVLQNKVTKSIEYLLDQGYKTSPVIAEQIFKLGILNRDGTQIGDHVIGHYMTGIKKQLRNGEVQKAPAVARVEKPKPVVVEKQIPNSYTQDLQVRLVQLISTQDDFNNSEKSRAIRFIMDGKGL